MEIFLKIFIHPQVVTRQLQQNQLGGFRSRKQCDMPS